MFDEVDLDGEGFEKLGVEVYIHEMIVCSRFSYGRLIERASFSTHHMRKRVNAYRFIKLINLLSSDYLHQVMH